VHTGATGTIIENNTHREPARTIQLQDEHLPDQVLDRGEMSRGGQFGDLPRITRGEHDQLGVKAVRDPRPLDDPLVPGRRRGV